MSELDTTTTKDFEHASKLTHLRLELALVMQTLRSSAGLTQAELAQRLGVNQPAIAKLERVGDHKIENVLRYLGELDAELLVAVRQGSDVIQVSDDREHLLVALPREIDDWAAAADMDLDAFVMDALRDAQAKTQTYDVRGGTFALHPAEFSEYSAGFGKAA
jgi:transcriptional regulator with XRE-family HTH domain